MNLRQLSTNQQRYMAGIVFTIPLLLVWGALLVLPICQTIYHSMTQWNGIRSAWIGFAGYARLFSDSTFWRVLLNNGFLLISVPFAVFIPLLIAFLLNEKVVGWKIFRTIIFLPATVSWVVIGMVSFRFFAGDGIQLGQIIIGVGVELAAVNDRLGLVDVDAVS